MKRLLPLLLILATCGRRSIPQTLVIDTGGGVVGHWVGYARGQNALRLREAIKSALP